MSKEWPIAQLGELLLQRKPHVAVEPGRIYQFAGVYSFGRGIFRGQQRQGSQFSYRMLTQLRAGEFVYPKLMAWEGAFGIVPADCNGCHVSPEFCVFEVRTERLLPEFLGLYFQIPSVWKNISGGSTGTNARRRRLNPAEFLQREIRLPPLAEQQQMVDRFEELSNQVREARNLRTESVVEQRLLLLGVYDRISRSAPRYPLGEIAPLTRRPVVVVPERHYPQIAVRSFGKGVIHKPALAGSEMTWEKPYLVKEGDILLSNIKAWEGAIAVVSSKDDGRFGSHRYLTCVPKPSVATARFVCFHLLTREGLLQVGEASPGSADRNRTLGTRALLQIPVPVPSFEMQCWFDEICRGMDALSLLQGEVDVEFSALLPSILNEFFRGKL